VAAAIFVRHLQPPSLCQVAKRAVAGVELQLSKLRLEPNRALEHAKRAHQQDHDTRDQSDALVIFLQPVHQRSLMLRLVLVNRSPVIPSEYASPARTEESLTIFCSIELRLRGRTRVITV